MSKLWNCVLALGMSALLLAPALADDAKPKKGKGNAARKEQPAVQLPKDITLTDEQKTKVAELEKEFAPKMKEVREKFDKLLTDEQKAARQEVLKEARTKGKEGKKGKELHQAVQDALKLSDDQKKKYEESEKELAALRIQIREKVEPILTDEQKAKLPKRLAANPKKKAK